MTTDEIITPPPLRYGDRIVILSPAGTVKNDYVIQAAEILSELGFDVRISPHALGKHNTYSGTPDQRFSDLQEAILDPSVKAILCARGGYGAVHLLERLQKLPLRENPKWLIGYSDISALHALFSRNGIISLHAPMAKHIATNRAEDSDSQTILSILAGTMPDYSLPPCEYNRVGEASGKLVGGNLAVIADLISTPYDVFEPGVILFIEDIAEPVYKVERIIYQLKLSGILENLGGLIVGKFTEYTPEVDGNSMEGMIAEMIADYDYPVAMNVPIGHVDHNLPMPVTAPVTLRVTPDETIIRFTTD